jgi:3-hydroxyisobutyrate dehydrogenase-like beta-hydroxyacid dehydrogenase
MTKLEPKADPRIGLIGLGNAGRAILEALSVDRTLRVYDRDSDRSQGLSEICANAPVTTASAAELARDVDLLLLSLPSPAASLSVAEEIRQEVRPGTVVVETSTVRAEDIEALQLVLEPHGARVIDAAVIGGVHRLAEGKGVFLVGLPEEDAGAAGAVLRSIAAEIFFLKKRGDGMRAKLVANAVAHSAYVLLLEAAALAAAQDIPLSVFYRLMERESGLLRPLTHRFGERLRKRDFAGGMSTLNARKDSGLILETARTLGVPLFAIPATHPVYEVAVRDGLGSLDYASIGRLWEEWLGISFAEEEARVPDADD